MKHEEYKWLCTAILAHIALNVRFTPRATCIIQHLNESESAMDAFKALAASMSAPNKFHIVEIDKEDVNKIITFVEQFSA